MKSGSPGKLTLFRGGDWGHSKHCHGTRNKGKLNHKFHK